MNFFSLYILLGLYLLIAALYLVSYFAKRVWLTRITFGGFVFALLINTYSIARRWMEGGQPPFQTLYETLIFFSWCTALTYILLELVYKWRLGGAAAAGFCAALLIYAASSDWAIRPLPPALKTPYFVPHVVSYFIAYGAFAVAFIASSIYLIRRYIKEVAKGDQAWAKDRRRRADMSPSESETRDPYTNKAINLGLPFLTFGLILGAFWAKEAWGAYWAWDPKETWALITWLIYVIYIHLRRLEGWQGKRACWLSVLGFLALLFTYLGIALLPTAWTSLHTNL